MIANNYLDPTNPQPRCMGEKWFIEKPLWKMSLLLGWDFSDNYLTKRGFSFYNYLPDDFVNKVVEFCQKYGIKYKIEMSLNHVQKIVVVSKTAKSLSIIDKLYNDFYKSLNFNRQ